MHAEILTKNQIRLLPLVRQFSKQFFLVGGTGIALHLGHRRSIDFDLFTTRPFENSAIKGSLSKGAKIEQIIRDEEGQYSLLANGVQMTFFHYPFKISPKIWFDDIIKIPSLLTLSAMKAYALGRRAKWKDYVDLFFILNKVRKIDAIAREARRIFGNEFNEKLFREQLCYYKDVNYSEKVIYLPGFSVQDSVVKKSLIQFCAQ